MQSQTRHRHLLAGFALVGLLGAALPTAGAGELVPFGDLDLATPAGHAVLEARLHAAAAGVCGLAEARHYAERQAAKRCAAATLDWALSKTRPSVLLARERAQSARESSLVSSGGSVRR
jgi:UrcA family protein